MDSIQYFKQNDQVLWRCLFIWACEGLSIPKALHIDVWEMAGVTAMAAGGEQTQSAHACDVSLGARIHIIYTLRWWFHLGSAYLHIYRTLTEQHSQNTFFATQPKCYDSVDQLIWDGCQHVKQQRQGR